MKILVSTPTFLPVVGGAELGIYEVFRRIARNHEVVVVTRTLNRGERNDWAADFAPAGLTVRRFSPMMPGWAPRWIRKIVAASGVDYVLAINRERRRGRIDVINLQFIRPHGLVAGFVGRLSSAPVVFSLIGRSDVYKDMNLLMRVYSRLSLSAAAAVTQNSGYYLDGSTYEGTVVPYGVNLDDFQGSQKSARELLGIDQGRPMLLSVQRMSSVKRVDQVVLAYERVRELIPETQLYLIGKGPELEHIADLVRERNLGGVHLLGFVEEAQLPLYYRAADVFVSHSMNETFGVVYAQALAAGTPVIAANTSCLPFVLPAEASTLVAPFDLDGFARAVVRVLTDERARADMGASAREYARSHFDWDANALMHQRLLEQTRESWGA